MTDRYFQFNRGFAVRDIFDALVELITNSDDSYHRMFENGAIKSDGGPILIEYQPVRKGKKSTLRVRDRAEGMTLDEMAVKLGSVGDKTSAEGDRGFMARGAKDCTALGEMLFESIKHNKYFACKLTKAAELVPLANGDKPTSSLRDRLGIRRGSGLSVQLSIDPVNSIPRLSTLVRDLPWQYAIRDIIHEESPSRVQVVDLNKPGSPAIPVVYRCPDADVLISGLEFEVPGYPGVLATLTILKSSEPLDSSGDGRFRKNGLIVKGGRAIHQCNLLLPEFESDPYSAGYFGRIECDHIDILLAEYDNLRSKDLTFPDSNPRLLIDPNRQIGLIPDHPFTKSLFQVPSERLRSLIAKDREKDQKTRNEIANKETKKRLDRLAKLASQFMKEQLEEAADVAAEDDIDKSAFTEKGLIIVPTFVRIHVGEEKKLWLYANESLIHGSSPLVDTHVDSDHIDILDPTFPLLPHPRKDDRLFGTFVISGRSATDAVCLQATVQNLPAAEAIVEVIEPGLEIRDFSHPLEFQHSTYKIREGSTRTLNLFAIFPDLVKEETPVKVWTDESGVAAVKGSCLLVPITNSNFAKAAVRVHGRRLNASTMVHASANGRDAHARIGIIQKEQKGVPIRIEIRDEDFNNFRAMWADHENQPHLLLVSSRHPSIKRYLGPGPEFSGQDSSVFRLLLAEIVAESVCRKVLRIDAKEHPWDYRLADYKDDVIIVDTVFAKLHARIRDFVAKAHSAMLSTSELT
jgi:hypothetical protein